jgi:uncharacterized protein (TIRG00374 family)
VSFIKKYQRQILGLIVLGVFIGYFALNKESFRPLTEIRPVYLIGVSLCYIAIVYTNGLFIKYVIEPYKKYISVSESTRVSLLSSLGNFFATSGAGLGFRAVYLKKKHGLGYSDYMTTLYGNYLLIFIINALFGLLSLGLVSNRTGVQFLGATMFFASLLFVSLVLCFVKLPYSFFMNSRLSLVKTVLRYLKSMTEGWNNIVSDKRLLLHLTSLITIQLFLTFLIGWLEFTSLQIEVGMPELLLFSVLGSLSIFVSLTPANLGVKEGIYLLTAAVIGITTPQIVSIALIDRGILFGTLFVLWLLIGRDWQGSKIKSREPKRIST